MRIIVATGLNEGAAEYQNMGDVAMLQAAVTRIRSAWPNAVIQVLTESPSNLARYCPGARPLSRAGCTCLVKHQIFPNRYRQLLPAKAGNRLRSVEHDVGARWPAFLEFLVYRKLSFRDDSQRLHDFDVFLDALNSADLLLVCGSGGFADSCQSWNLFALGVMEAAIQRGVAVAMFGQGMGPLTDKIVLSRAREILPKVDLITLRGSRGGATLLESCGVRSSQIMTTGDEAIEAAYQNRGEGTGNGIGINLRVATYSGVQENFIDQIGAALRQFAQDRKAPVLPVPIAFHNSANDHLTIRRLLQQLDDKFDGGLSLDSPLQLIQQVSRCRVMVTGAYHAAVFALAQGIPVVCLHNSEYYAAKFQGLADHFGLGCSILSLAGPELQNRLATAMESAWNAAPAVRSSLLQAARAQIAKTHEAYEMIERLVALDEAVLPRTQSPSAAMNLDPKAQLPISRGRVSAIEL